MRIDILTLFPEMFAGPLDASIIGRARQASIIDVRLVNIRDFAEGKHKVTDDYPYGGGTGMVMKPEPVFKALDWIIEGRDVRPWILLMTPQGRVFTQETARFLSKKPGLVFVCGHYEGVDERIRLAVDDELSIGDYILTGGEIPCMVIVDAVSRLLPGVLGHSASAANDSFSEGILEGPQYTRPPEFRGMEVPEILLSGDHGKVRRWRRKEALRRTLARRGDLIQKVTLNREDEEILEEIRAEGGTASAAEGARPRRSG